MSQLISCLPKKEVFQRLRHGGLSLRTGPYVYRITTSLPEVCKGICDLYGDHEVPDDDVYTNFDISLNYPSRWRRLIRPKVIFNFDYQQPFAPIAPDQAYAFLEWGMNWCVAQYTNQYLKLHASVLEKSGQALIMPGSPGAGKSTLCAALMLAGWRLLSDEFALISRDDLSLTALCRPIGLKNESIELVQGREKGLVMGPPSRGTHKGTVVHLKPTQSSVEGVDKQAQPAIMLFPKYQEGAEIRLDERLKETAFIVAAQQSFNYSLLGREGFELMEGLIDRCRCFDLKFSDLDEAIGAIDSLVESTDV
ncbi:HprK-related kinase A [Pseudomaricurvus alcaniphilus]|uniref:HprK-related kinase A n=1 Tax=Pseudomaricurvus alcaniphilus TaxID=1166482 RepID=UPI001409C57A|nr:HprK-related kinase A [Pseudomaricurvus alcaniphilus]NHN36689.1 HprK-related kinase A [Pseudomaricurvus alcaniphilus]